MKITESEAQFTSVVVKGHSQARNLSTEVEVVTSPTLQNPFWQIELKGQNVIWASSEVIVEYRRKDKIPERRATRPEVITDFDPFKSPEEE